MQEWKVRKGSLPCGSLPCTLFSYCSWSLTCLFPGILKDMECYGKNQTVLLFPYVEKVHGLIVGGVIKDCRIQLKHWNPVRQLLESEHFIFLFVSALPKLDQILHFSKWWYSQRLQHQMDILERLRTDDGCYIGVRKKTSSTLELLGYLVYGR